MFLCIVLLVKCILVFHGLCFQPNSSFCCYYQTTLLQGIASLYNMLTLHTIVVLCSFRCFREDLLLASRRFSPIQAFVWRCCSLALKSRAGKQNKLHYPACPGLSASKQHPWTKVRTGLKCQEARSRSPRHPKKQSTVGSQLHVSELRLSVSEHLDVDSCRHVFSTSGKDVALTGVLLQENAKLLYERLFPNATIPFFI